MNNPNQQMQDQVRTHAQRLREARERGVTPRQPLYTIEPSTGPMTVVMPRFAVLDWRQSVPLVRGGN